MRLVPIALASATVLALAALPSAQAPAFAQTTQSETEATATGALTITFTGFSEPTGQVMVALFDEAGWNGGEPVGGAVVDLAAGETTVTIEGLPAGRYGIKAFHDANGNGEMDLNPFGMPTEAFAFSNNAPASMGPAKWEAAAFEVTADGAEQTLTIR